MTQPGSRDRVPSLLRSLLYDHLDPGYAAAARKRVDAGTRSPRARRIAAVWLVSGALLVGMSLGLARGFAEERAPDADQVRASLQAEIRSAQARSRELALQRDALAAEAAAARSQALALDAPGQALLSTLHRAENAAGSVPVSGPGLMVMITEPPGQRDLSGASRPTGQRNTILDRDLQIVVNALWQAGAEAVAVGDVRVGPGVAIRQAGSAILVDNRVAADSSGTYVISAVGDRREMQSRFIASGAYIRMSGISQLYGAAFTVREESEITLPAAPVREVRSAVRLGTEGSGIEEEGEP
ncbi:uncharacterized protein YlxW (UPF0749 family) [Hoyosella altamirensis]|uniref:Uncharacterized protein YlxW (UPF0749 family) n=1 Tax=Hoyosella altamirensis TaxID=616997 RepID=A0A839RJE2_9ACTN|nr:uncharacterized protein YlxW (UPF0749 family) [Hoyosella altamirensis]